MSTIQTLLRTDQHVSCAKVKKNDTKVFETGETVYIVSAASQLHIELLPAF